MAEEAGSLHLNYIKQQLLPEIMEVLKTESLDTCEVEHLSGLDGFMSILYEIKLCTKAADGSNKNHLLMVKLMKGNEEFRESSKSYTQFANEVYIYGKVLPAYEQLLKSNKVPHTTIENWVPHAYVAKFGYIEGLSAAPSKRESVLVLENLKPHGYVLGPRLYLTREQLLRMCEPLAQYHAMSYVLRLCDAPQLERLRNGILPLPFINDNDPTDVQHNLYRVFYRIAFDRFYEFFDRKIVGSTFDRQNADDLKLIERLRQLREKYFEEPTRLLERIRTGVLEREQDKRFGAILHGDFTRNNVLFHFAQLDAGEREGERKVANVKMLDFQETRYSTPCIDLSFYMYLNTPSDKRAEVWLEILKNYHKHMYEILEASVRGNAHVTAEQLEDYNFENFYAHFSRYAFFGVIKCLHFLPWMLCSEAVCAKLAHLFATDMHSEAFREASYEACNDEINMELLALLRHVCKMGYMEQL